MKRVLVFLLAFVLLFSLFSCGNSLGKACGKANDYIRKLNMDNYQGCRFKGEYYDESEDGYPSSNYLVIIQVPFSDEIKNSKYGQSIINSTMKMAAPVADEVSSKLVKIFEGTDVTVVVVLQDDSGYSHYALVNGEEYKFE
ncbi:MAG: hypothetical protein IJD67_03515 [Clostridia bacterium]|nr:hypothetical protein [Clostridia bacterium]